ncbi:DUF1189 domain-containing protein [Bacillus sp. FJAT-29790]|uniref:DUF1189 domain-containing protein n=1 Tax=Bacillus sp. FJAT-29790 TaxID=1895002 RepID=UPI001C227AB8|nr:DUF1189 domain-containing protein [Bacillus sp. FJAT-29790]MBU8879401.1 DUF1189 domain-containing protein [Bacillus sp. FJAT-29790]
MNIFKQFFKSLYSPKDIALFRFQGIGKTILYVFVLVFLSIIPSVYYFSSAIISGVAAVQSSIENEIPSFSIENGELQSDQAAPVIINKDRISIIFDSTGTVDPKSISNSDNTIAILKDGAFFFAGGEIQSLPYSMLNDLTLTKEDLSDILVTVDSSLGVIIPLMAAVMYIFSAGLKFIEVSVLALLGLLLKKMLVRNIQYRHTWRIAAYSVTLPTLFFTIMASLKTTVPNGAFINWFVAFMVLFLAIKEIPQPKKK